MANKNVGTTNGRPPLCYRTWRTGNARPYVVNNKIVIQIPIYREKNPGGGEK